ncbi:hypothetical protein GCM10007084_33720 [Parabacteroides faecis]|nr:hypothetical protein DWX23_11295 [Parabacteroides sp. AF18-52]GGK07898.1 hypothetical protein GCM10007084_33720 [Parabacteroides faecis]
MMKMNKYINLIFSLLLVVYMFVSYIITDGRQLLYGSDRFMTYLPPILMVITLYIAIVHGKQILIMYKSKQIYKAIYVLIMTLILLSLFIYTVLLYYSI